MGHRRQRDGRDLATARLAGLALLGVLGCDPGVPPPTDAAVPEGVDGGPASNLGVTPRFTSATFPGCTYASPVRAISNGRVVVLAADDRGTIRALDPSSGTTLWELVLAPQIEGHRVELLPTPAVLDDTRAVIGWQDHDTTRGVRVRTRLAVLDLDTHALDPTFAPFDLAATFPAADGSGEVVYEDAYQLLRAAIHLTRPAGTTLGLAYVSMGNGPSVQPFHGWLFELDLDRWAAGGDPIASRFLTTATNDCGPRGGREARYCGGGLWNAAGVQIVGDRTGDYEIFATTGNGHLDFDVASYAYSILRLRRGLAFERECDESLCADFDAREPSLDCLASCRNVFSPRLEPGQSIAPADGRCDGLPFMECLHAIDGDLGASAPVVLDVPGGPRVLVQPAKDGGVYLLDAAHLGTMYQRLPLMDACGAADDPCIHFWMGSLVTHPVVAHVDGVPHVVLASVMADRTHPSGITALRVVMRDGQPRMEIAWQVPDFSTRAAVEAFRHHPGRPVLLDVDGEPVVLVVETRRSGAGDDGAPPGILWGVRVRDGSVLVQQPIEDAGQRFAIPLVVDDAVYLSTCNAAASGEGRIQAFTLTH